MKRPALIVDGHSIIFAWPDLRRLHSRRSILGREDLLKRLLAYADATGTLVVAVFDGQGSEMTEEKFGAVQVFYSKKGKTADALIERLVARHAPGRRITVATDDTHEQITVNAFGAEWISSDGLKALLSEAATDFDRETRKHRRKDR